ncbi:MAG TPA: RimK family alpha-L-glutamate ligase [Desulfonatronum sp.]|nr:RimK family alpha-L-glutamate ligase [Desulfonatronum sp.]
MVTQQQNPQKIAIGRQLRHCSSVFCLGARTNLSDYSADELALIREAPKIYFPTGLLAEPLAALGKLTFPSIQTYRFAGNKILQTHLFQLLGLPMPRTRVYYGPRQQTRIAQDFSLPLIAKVPRNSSRGLGVFLIRTQAELQGFIAADHPAYIQEYLPITRDLRVVILGRRIVHAYWRQAPPEDFRSNVSQGGRISFADVPASALELALDAAKRCGFDHVGMDLCEHGGRFFFLEANMTFGLKGFRVAGLDFKAILRDMVENNEV